MPLFQIKENSVSLKVRWLVVVLPLGWLSFSPFHALRCPTIFETWLITSALLDDYLSIITSSLLI